MSLLKLIMAPMKTKALQPGVAGKELYPMNTFQGPGTSCPPNSWEAASGTRVLAGSLRWAGVSQTLLDCQSSSWFLLCAASSDCFPFRSLKPSHPEGTEGI